MLNMEGFIHYVGLFEGVLPFAAQALSVFLLLCWHYCTNGIIRKTGIKSKDETDISIIIIIF